MPSIKTQGFTLLELMIASTLGLLIVMSLLSLLRLQVGFSHHLTHDMSSNKRVSFLYSTLKLSLHQASILRSQVGVEFIDPQRIRIRYQAGQNTDNCLGVSMLPGSLATDEFYLQNNSVYCRSNYYTRNNSSTDNNLSTDKNQRLIFDTQPILT